MDCVLCESTDRSDTTVPISSSSNFWRERIASYRPKSSSYENTSLRRSKENATFILPRTSEDRSSAESDSETGIIPLTELRLRFVITLVVTHKRSKMTDGTVCNTLLPRCTDADCSTMDTQERNHTDKSPSINTRKHTHIQSIHTNMQQETNTIKPTHTHIHTNVQTHKYTH